LLSILALTGVDAGQAVQHFLVGTETFDLADSVNTLVSSRK